MRASFWRWSLGGQLECCGIILALPGQHGARSVCAYIAVEVQAALTGGFELIVSKLIFFDARCTSSHRTWILIS
jgi:hypothetical protein